MVQRSLFSSHTVVVTVSMPGVAAVTPVHEKMQCRTQNQQRVGEYRKNVGGMLRDQEESGDGEKG
jgi:hypothetical protein